MDEDSGKMPIIKSGFLNDNFPDGVAIERTASNGVLEIHLGGDDVLKIAQCFGFWRHCFDGF